jgi:hypothetical protein
MYDRQRTKSCRPPIWKRSFVDVCWESCGTWLAERTELCRSIKIDKRSELRHQTALAIRIPTHIDADASRWEVGSWMPALVMESPSAYPVIHNQACSKPTGLHVLLFFLLLSFVSLFCCRWESQNGCGQQKKTHCSKMLWGKLAQESGNRLQSMYQIVTMCSVFR